MVKPYTRPLDSLLEITDTFGDLVVLICAIPFHMCMSVYHRFVPPKPENSVPEIEEETQAKPNGERKMSSSSVANEDEIAEGPARGTVRVRRRPLQDAHERAQSTRAANTIKPANGGPKASTHKAVHEIWYPPPPAYDESPPSEANETLPDVSSVQDASVDEWTNVDVEPLVGQKKEEE